ncbi:hypothetical protein DINM_003550 [Dirofilaria immitis]|nr:hypothetical protein [Dirofilaria immitis]
MVKCNSVSESSGIDCPYWGINFRWGAVINLVKQESNSNAVDLDKSEPFNLTIKDTDAAAKAKRRLVYGLKEVRKQLSLETVRCVILARDIDTNKSIAILDYSGAEVCSKFLVNTTAIIISYEDAYNLAIQTLANFTACCRIADHVDQPSFSV